MLYSCTHIATVGVKGLKPWSPSWLTNRVQQVLIETISKPSLVHGLLSADQLPQMDTSATRTRTVGSGCLALVAHVGHSEIGSANGDRQTDKRTSSLLKAPTPLCGHGS